MNKLEPRSSRLRTIQRQIAEGTYVVNPDLIAEAILRQVEQQKEPAAA